MNRGVVALLSLLVTGSLFAGGCQVPTRGASATWVQMDEELRFAENQYASATGEYRTTAYNNLQQAQARRDQALRAAQSSQPVGMWETAAEQAAKVAATELPAVVKKADTKGVIIMRSGGGSPESASVVRSLQTRMFNADPVRQNFVLLGLESTDSDRALAAAGAGQAFEFVDPLATGQNAAAPIKYNPASIYVLDCSFTGEKDTNSPRYICRADMKLSSARTRQITWAKQHQTEFIYHPDPRVAKWVTAEEDRALEETYQQWRLTEGKNNLLAKP